jgi:hypothetical protein
MKGKSESDCGSGIKVYGLLLKRGGFIGAIMMFLQVSFLIISFSLFIVPPIFAIQPALVAKKDECGIV